MLEKIKKKCLSGGGEVLGFIAILPCLCFVLVFIVGAFQVGSIKERMEYTAYLACRAAVSEKNLEDAKAAAKKAAEEDLQKSGNKNVSNMKVDLKIITPNEDGEKTEWSKGNAVQCLVTADIHNVPDFFNRHRLFTITMMIENPASEGEDGEYMYRWFRDYEKKHGG